MRMQSGNAARRGLVEIQRPRKLGKTKYGETESAWEKFDSDYFEITGVNGKEFVDANQVKVEGVHLARGRNRKDLSADMRLVSGTEIYNLFETPRPSENSQDMEFLVKRVK